MSTQLLPQDASLAHNMGHQITKRELIIQKQLNITVPRPKREWSNSFDQCSTYSQYEWLQRHYTHLFSNFRSYQL